MIQIHILYAIIGVTGLKGDSGRPGIPGIDGMFYKTFVIKSPRTYDNYIYISDYRYSGSSWS